MVTGSSTPRSPRATMMPSEASRISAKALTAAGFSILERIAARPSASSRASKTSVGRCTKESASQSTPSVAGELEVLAVLGRQRGERQHHVGHVDALAVGDLAADHHLGQSRARASSRCTFSRILPSLTRSVEPALSAAKISGCGRQTRVASPSAGSRSKRKRAPSAQHHRAGGEGAAPELRPLQVGEDADRPADLGLDLANQRVPPGDVVVGAVAHVEPEHVGAGEEQARGSSRRCRRRGRGWRRS